VADFQRILSEIETRDVAAAAFIAPAPTIVVAASDDAAQRICSPRRAIDAYFRLRDVEAEREMRAGEALAIPASFSRMLAEASFSPEKLRTLRRSVAWRLHPDRNPPEAAPEALAEWNAAIDEALARRRVNSVE